MSLDSAKEILQNEINDSPHVKNGLLGHAGTFRKIKEYVIESAIAGETEEECKGWFRSFLKENGIEDEFEHGKLSEIVGYMQSIVKQYISNEKEK
ncbi:tRNA-dihydrouridine synthase [Parabacteroides sp. PF5-5]|uniref:hypothetical protein n=1 Tax=unclassified Parabacteroides TaxID=2649774 RepID=UPI002474BFBD|nr:MULTISPECIES: hypothetical protein [unclassified Parabacteroides]MDH6304286.1 tRNA-dihydrouridine synthase [Parabacteroides sp. PH5-39]MDH6314999.1 tRNA-dihydrouridine synthase [Parabacteroides sp. PF5-13]MDH6318659.1 tRNA-dihydrouridine synthase [Parabacteroides sp. PH5-13]MDH6322389.1 tRNA-dihydrouridine synthase [Parabacteroides sp. PH5-8]MDH6326476.1 tRNA-dihydrouridine synthase [Parabacteroides sp. PH5-41]